MSWFIEWFAEMTWWKALGIFGQVVFGSRFFVQWWMSERAQRSVVPVAFWYLSILGGIIIMAYAIHIENPVFAVPQVAALLIYGRNLTFIYRDRRRSHGLMEPDQG